MGHAHSHEAGSGFKYYPLYGEPLPWDQGANYPVSWVLLITFLSISAVANALCIYLAVRIRMREHRKSQTSTLFLFLNAEGLCFNVLCVIQCIGNITHMSFSWKEFGCRYQSFYATLLMLSYGFSLALLATASDRLVRHNKRLPKNFILNYHVIVWLYCGLAAVLLSIWPGTPKLMASGTFCFPALANPLGIIMFFIGGVGACTVYLIALYWRLYRFVRAKMRAADESQQTLDGLIEATDASVLAAEERDMYGILPPNLRAAQAQSEGEQQPRDAAASDTPRADVAAAPAAVGAPPLVAEPDAEGLRSPAGLLQSVVAKIPFWGRPPARRPGPQLHHAANQATGSGVELSSRAAPGRIASGSSAASGAAPSEPGHRDDPSALHMGPRSHAGPGSIAGTLPVSPTSPHPLLRADSVGGTTNPAGSPQTLPFPDAGGMFGLAALSAATDGADPDKMPTIASRNGGAGGQKPPTVPPGGSLSDSSSNGHANGRKAENGNGNNHGGTNGHHIAMPVNLAPAAADALAESKREAARSATAAAKEAKQAGRHWIFARRAGMFFAIYVLCWSPFVFITAFQLVTQSYPHPVVDVVGAQTGHLNTFFNPLLHILFNSQFRRELRLLVAEALAAVGLHTASEWWFSSEEAAAGVDGSMGGMYAAPFTEQFSYPAAGVQVADGGSIYYGRPHVNTGGTPVTTATGR